MRFVWRWLKRGVFALMVLAVVLLLPVGWNAVACRGDLEESSYNALIATENRRALAATYLTYPEWHIVFAYDDYAKTLETGDPHDFDYLRAIFGFWSALCDLTARADTVGGSPETTRMVYVIGVSFTAEFLAKAAYEETLGRIATWIRGSEMAQADRISTDQAKDYAAFLHQVPWYKYDFDADRAALANTGSGLRNLERRWALGLEYGVKQAYAGVIAKAVAAVGPADLEIRSVISGLDLATLRTIEGVAVIAASPDLVEIETPRYATFTEILRQIADAGGEVVEIAGNDRIMLTVTGDKLPARVASGGVVIAELRRQGYGDRRWLVEVEFASLASTIRALVGADSVQLEHIFDY